MLNMKRTLVTDRKILRCIYDMHLRSYPGPELPKGKHENDPYVPISVREIAAKLGCTPQLLFGRLYYHLDAKYRYKQDGGAEVHLFTLKVGDQMHCVHFPFLAATLAEHDAEHRKFAWTLWLSIVALALSSASIVSQVISAS
ncbi:hypothetical protein MKP05_19325 [Halomonas sp. EGI 63088]|uniref:Uncharacterized protein n=1 Tax=Halomonas flagellata TaxID=2920385 RepID=A0ABS9RZH5_9GAMM|nr:hypothetical protein [Halomonas flagellata]MCH4565255.1 hypothetical protein [Halomonas flagellata]